MIVVLRTREYSKPNAHMGAVVHRMSSQEDCERAVFKGNLIGRQSITR